MKYLFLKIKIINGNYEHYACLIITTKCKNIEFALHKTVASFYGYPTSRYGYCWNFYNGEISCLLDNWKELTKKEFDILNKFI